MEMVTLARHAMATRFELVLHGEDAVALRAAGEEALDEIQRLEAQLSLYQPSSEIAHLNSRAARGPVRITPSLFALLEQATQLSLETAGAFDITIAPLVKCWGFMGGTGKLPSAAEIEQARSCIGMQHLRLNRSDYTVSFDREGVMLDLGAIGKGYAIEQSIGLLREAGVTSALLHGGTSTVYGLGSPPETEAWKVAIHHPDPKREEPLTTVRLRDEALSVSAVWGRSFQANEKTLGHVIDPRTGHPSSRSVLTAVILPSATESDALSTALLIAGPDGHNAIAKLRPQIRTLLVHEAEGELKIDSHGIPAGER
jgi:thiamine biosynthesis lipoprotein